MTNTAHTEAFSDVPWTLGDVLTKVRKLAGLSVQDMADALGVSRNTVGNYENDRNRPNKATLIVWAQLTDADWLVEWGESELRTARYLEGAGHGVGLAA